MKLGVLLPGFMLMMVLAVPLRAQVVDSLAGYFPLAVGNVWQYTYSRTTGSRILVPYSVEIDRDTVMPNGRRYVHAIGRASGTPPIYMAMPTGYLRYTFDSVSTRGGLVAYDTVTGSEREVGEGFFQQWHQRTRGIVFGDSVEVIAFGHDIAAYADTCARGFGIVQTFLGECESEMHPCENHVLVYAKIDGREYGRYLSAPALEAEPTAALDACTPNPFSASTTISFTLPRRGHLLLDVVSAAGMRVATLVDGDFDAGSHRATLDGAGLPGGLYIVRLRVGGTALTRSTVLVK